MKLTYYYCFILSSKLNCFHILPLSILDGPALVCEGPEPILGATGAMQGIIQGGATTNFHTLIKK